MKFRAFGYSLLGLSFALAAHAAEPQAPAEAAAAPAEAPAPRRVTLGPVGRDAAGREGRIHTVERGDTLWDISDAYLGTPWVWPALWSDNRTEVENPHLIRPGWKLWVSPWEMRVVSDDEARKLMAGQSPPAALEDADARPARRVRLSSAEATGFATLEEIRGAGSVLAIPDNKTMAVQTDVVTIDLGAERLRVGDQVAFFHTQEKVIDPVTRKQIGQFVSALGWGNVIEMFEQTARVDVQRSFAEIEPGHRYMRREIVSTDIPVRMPPPGVEGRLVHLPNRRTSLGAQDVVYLDQGLRGGLSVGSELEVYRPGPRVKTDEHKKGLQLEDEVIGRVLVVSVQDANAVALVTRTSTELVHGDRFRSPSK
jgi:hypothetical protein